MDIGVVLVTFNRINDLKKALKHYENQQKKPSYIIVVNNNSSDGTEEALEEWKNVNNNIEKYVINLKENIGGSGGFYKGLELALKMKSDWIWVADDDAYADEKAFSNAEKFLRRYSDINEITALCGAVINNNKIDISHRRRIKKNTFRIIEEVVPKEEYNSKYFELDLFSYVGTIISKKYMNKVGITERDYFIYCDDTEHSYRLSRCGKIICDPSIRVVHDTEFQNREEISWKSYYAIRNRILFIKKHFPKRYFIYEYYRNLIRVSIKKIKNTGDQYNTLIYEANNDAKNNIKGIHKIYRPGWKYIR